jgi:ubiquinone/menaquinone biosynthesis C-methylase UbiE
MNFIDDFWENQAKKFGTSSEASWGDVFALELESNVVKEHLFNNASVLDAGCANGFAILKHAQHFKLSKSAGIDYSPKMIEMAAHSQMQSNRNADITFSVGDVRKLNFNDNQFDVVYTTRVLINLQNWEEQLQGINECIRVAKPGGTVIFSEAFWEPLVKLNALRAVMGLAPLVEHDFNRYLKKEKLEAFLKNELLPFEVNNFSSLYYLGSRLIRELIPESKRFIGYNNPVNKFFFDLENNFSGGDAGIQQAYIIKKPAK